MKNFDHMYSTIQEKLNQDKANFADTVQKRHSDEMADLRDLDANNARDLE